MRPLSDKTAVRLAIEATAASDGSIVAEKIIEAARDARSPLHEHFTWDDAIAGHERRLDQARALIRRVEYESSTEELTFPTVAYVHDPRTRDQKYVPLARAVEDRALSLSIVMAELARVTSCVNRLRAITEALGVQAELDGMDSAIEVLREGIERRAAARRRRSGVPPEARP
jgi:hypothetical protein